MRTVESFIPAQQYRYYYSILDADEQEAYRRLLRAMLRHSGKVDFTGINLKPTHLEYLTSCLKYDVPELLKACKTTVYAPTSDGKSVKHCYVEEQLTIAEHIEQLAVCEQRANSIVADALQERGGIGRAKAVHDWFARHCTYDGQSVPQSHTAYGAFAHRTSVCEGFSLSAKMCYDRLGYSGYLSTTYDAAAQLCCYAPA